MLLGDEKYIFITGRRAVSIGQPWKPDYAAEIGMIEKMLATETDPEFRALCEAKLRECRESCRQIPIRRLNRLSTSLCYLRLCLFLRPLPGQRVTSGEACPRSSSSPSSAGRNRLFVHCSPSKRAL